MRLQKRIQSKFHYDNDSGRLIRRETIDNCRIWKAGSVVGTRDKDGYIVTHFEGKHWKLHHLVWVYHYGYKPKMLDHINKITSDNRIENLREATKSLNAYNTHKQANNTSGFKGVSWNERIGKWHSYIGSKKSRKHLGFFSSKEEAINARFAKEKEMGVDKIQGVG